VWIEPSLNLNAGSLARHALHDVPLEIVQDAKSEMARLCEAAVFVRLSENRLIARRILLV
jgi:hypothetical protein